MTILITGITGRIGTNIAKTFMKSGHEITGFVWHNDPQSEKMRNLGCEVIEGDLENFDDVLKAVNQQQIVFHLGAAFQAGGPFSPNQYFDINVKGTFNVLQACSQTTTIEHVIATSTDSTISKYPVGGLAESIKEFSLPQDEVGWYGYSKILSENLCRRFFKADKVPVSILRFSMVLGRGEVCGWAQFYTGNYINTLSNLNDESLSQSLKELNQNKNDGKELIIVNDVNGRPWKKHVVDIRDIVHAYEMMTNNTNTFGKTYQIAGKSSFTWDEAIVKLSETLNLDYCSVNLPITPTFYEFDLSLAKNDFNYSPNWGIVEMIEDDFSFNDGEAGDVEPAEEKFRRGYKI